MVCSTFMKIFRAIVLLFIPLAAVFGADSPKDVTPESVLADQVKAVASSRVPTKEKQRAIASAVRFAVAAATEGITDQVQILKITLKFTTAAAKAAPDFVDAIVSGISGIQGISDIDGAVAAIRESTVQTAKDSIDPDSGAGDSVKSAPSSSTTNSGFGGNTGDVVVSPTT
jgi:hypothetical protein